MDSPVRPYRQARGGDGDDAASVLVDDDRPPPPRQKGIMHHVGKAVRCCVCAPIVCAMRTVLTIVLVTLLVVVALTLGLYFGLRQTETGAAIVDQIQHSIVGTVITTIATADDSLHHALYRHRFSTLDSMTLLPAGTPYGDLHRQLGPGDTWVGWIDMQPAAIRTNWSSSSSSRTADVRLILGMWDALGGGTHRLIPLDTTDAPTCALITAAWSTRPSVVFAVLFVPANALARLGLAGPTPTWDQIVGQVLALARVL
jgi:hypothetical protein